MNDLLSFEFETRAIRVIERDGVPWWLAADLAQLLGYSSTKDMTRNLDDDEKDGHNVPTPGGKQRHTIISESGLFAAILKSRRPEARRFRRWVTGEVLPALRRRGSYAMPGAQAVVPIHPEGWDSAALSAGVAAVREARRLFGMQSARLVWRRLGLPAPLLGEGWHGDPVMPELQAWCATMGECTIDEAAHAIGLAELDAGTRVRIGQMLRALGWHPSKVRRGRVTVNLFTPLTARVVGQ